MREVMKWSKDYRTGEVITEKAYKPDNVKGKALIQLFRDGEVVKEVETHNIIVPPSSLISTIHYEDMYQSLMVGSSISAGRLNYSANSFAYMVLTDCEDMEDETKMAVRGNITGWCIRTDQTPGNDTTRGAYNPIESYIEYVDGYYHCHLVYDFGTSQGNGEFNSIWWTTMCNNSSKQYACAPIRIAPLSPYYRMNNAIKKPSNTFINRLYDGTMVCGNKNDGYKSILNYKNWINGIEPMITSLDDVDTTSNVLKKVNGSAFMHNGVTKLGSIDSTTMPTADKWQNNSIIDTAEFVFKRLLASDLSVDNELKLKLKTACPDIYDSLERAVAAAPSGTIKVSNFGGSFVTSEGIMYGYIFCENDSNSTNQMTFPSLQNGNMVLNNSHKGYFGYAFNLITSQWVIKPGFTVESMSMSREGYFLNGYDKINIGGVEVICSSGNGYSLGVLTNNVYTDYNSDWLAHSGSSADVHSFSAFDEFDSCAAGDGKIYKVVPSACAHTKLPNKVVKTSADTMKIQYDYYIQIPYMLTNDDNYIPPLT